MPQVIKLGAISIEVVLKDIKNIHLSVYPPHGRVKIAAPRNTKIDNLRVFAISKLDWIKKQQRKLREQARETPREYLNRESHYVWGKRYLLKVVERDAAPFIELKHNHMIIYVRDAANEQKKREVTAQWYRDQIKKMAPKIIEKWEPLLGVRVKGFYVQRMRTKWGSCAPATKNIRLNTDLARKPRQCLEYIIVHELIHILEPSHNARFISLIDKHYPRWTLLKKKLNELPVQHEDWQY